MINTSPKRSQDINPSVSKQLIRNRIIEPKQDYKLKNPYQEEKGTFERFRNSSLPNLNNKNL